MRGGWRTFFLMPYPNKDTPIQFLHLEDALERFRIMLDQRLEGTYNVSPDTYGKVGQIPNILNVSFTSIKGTSLVSMEFQWKLLLSRTPPSYLDFVAYPFVASNQKMKELGHSPKYSIKEVLLSFKGI